MGLVPWVRGTAAAAAPYVDVHSHADREPAAASREGGLHCGRVPGGPAASGPLPFMHAGQPVIQTGTDKAPLLVVAEGTCDPSGPLMSAPEFELLGAMLKSIGLAAKDFSVCAVAHAARAQQEHSLAGLLGSGLLDTGRAAVLWLDTGAAALGAVDVRFSMPRAGEPLTGFRVPHPARLLTHPLQKRDAWLALKALRAYLSEAGQLT